MYLKVNKKFFEGLTVEQLRKPLAKIGVEMQKATQENFKNEHDPNGKEWASLGKDYLAHKKRKGYGSKKLVKTGRLRKSLNKYDLRKTSVGVSTDVPYAKYHQYGIGVPKRKMVGMTDKQFNRYKNIILAEVVKQKNKGR